VTRAVLDPGVLVSALITPDGAPAKLLGSAAMGHFELVASPLLLEELELVLQREKFRRYVGLDEVAAFLMYVEREAEVVPDPEDPPPVRCSDPADDYLIALSRARTAALVSGDRHLLELTGRIPVFSPAEFLTREP
jgi:putative PIN family toxin of toxin-antitoxin system